MLFIGAAWGGQTVDVRVERGRVAAIRDRATAPGLIPEPGEVVHVGGRLTPPIAEPHCHLDAALLGARAPNRSGTLREGIRNWAALRSELTAEDVTARAIETAEMYASRGTLRIRTHVDTGSRVAVDALVALKPELQRRGIELQVVAFPQEGILRAPGRRAGWEAAIDAGCDVVGAIPHFERTTEEGWESVRIAFALAEERGLPVDLHCDESDDPQCRNLEVVCAQALDRGMAGMVVAGHCTALHSAPEPYAAKVMELVAEAGVMVVANPLDNIVLQGRYDGYPRRRGVTRVDQLWAAGATVGIGHDSVQDPWYRLGTACMLDPAWMLVHVGHLTSEADMLRVFETLHGANHGPWGGPDPLYEEGRARLLWWEDADPVEILRTRKGPAVVERGL